MSPTLPPTLSVGDRVVGPGHAPLVIAEIAQAHDGSLGFAHAFIDAAADAGAGAVKFQTHIAAAESARDEPWRVKFSPQDDTRYDYWRRMEFTEDQWHGLRRHAHDAGVLFISSPFSEAAVELLTRVGVDAWKVASGEVTNGPMFDRMAAGGQPFLLSTGMSPWAEIEAAAARVAATGRPCGVLQCTSMYPTPPEKWGLNVLGELRARLGCPVGLSDHSATTAAGLAAVALGADMLEVHACFDRRMFGPDTVASLTFDELKALVDGARAIALAHANPVDKDAVAKDLAAMRRIFTKKIVAVRTLAAGHALAADDLTLKKTAQDGLPPEALGGLVGRRLRRDVAPDEAVVEAVLEPEGPA